jgi:hypothetical protein
LYKRLRDGHVSIFTQVQPTLAKKKPCIAGLLRDC